MSYEFSREQIRATDEPVMLAFRERLRLHLEARHPALLPWFPLQTREKIVKCLIQRGLALGLSWQSSLALYCDLSEAIAPNFFQDEVFIKFMEHAGAYTNERFLTLPERMRELDWERMSEARCDLVLYTEAKSDSNPVLERTTSALGVVLWEQTDASDRQALAVSSIQSAAKLGLDGLADAPLVMAVTQALYASASASDRSWLNDLKDARSGHEKLAMIRFRLMLDFGRRV